ncbi:hypothetical protein NC651_004049 [Populus alba x Populus x berolinensis]|nr:hypothetical protein NC651_004049 [Populus alba x Populus x berolinensis]
MWVGFHNLQGSCSVLVLVYSTHTIMTENSPCVSTAW